jgi:hypothetical protein
MGIRVVVEITTAKKSKQQMGYYIDTVHAWCRDALFYINNHITLPKPKMLE